MTLTETQGKSMGITIMLANQCIQLCLTSPCTGNVNNVNKSLLSINYCSLLGPICKQSALETSEVKTGITPGA